MYVCIILGDDRPTPVDLLRFLVAYGALWKDIGLLLGLQLPVLNEVEKNHSEIKECFRAVLEKWLSSNVDVTWRNLELAISNANRFTLGLGPISKKQNM